MRFVWLKLAVLGLAAVGVAGPAAAQEYGTLTGKFVLDGAKPAPTPIVVDKDAAVCGKFGLVDETVAVGKDNGLANVVLWLDSDDVKVHPDLADPAKLPPVVMDNAKCRFAPRITTAMVGQTVTLKNSDPVAHNMSVAFFTNTAVNPLIPPMSKLDKTFTDVEKRPAEVTCSIHPWMKGYLVLKKHPYVGVSGDDGSFKIEKLPVGTHEFIVWHETGYPPSINVGGKDVKLSRGKYEVTVKAGDNDLGAIKIKGSDLK